jgi:pimeloyl-ACP methyl ester carboxylesterase
VTVPSLPLGVPAAGTSGATGASGASGTSGGDPAGRSYTVAFRQFGSGPDLVMVVGQSGSMAWWAASLLENLHPHYRVTLFDLPGIGWSGPAPGFTPSVASYADATAGLLQVLGIRRPTLVGWGMGGEVAMEVALRHPGSAARLVLVDSSGGGPAAAPTPAATSAILGSSATTPARLANLLFPAQDTGDRAAWLLAMLQAGPDDVVASALSAQAAAQAAWWRAGAPAAELSGIGLPTMVVWGTADAVFPPSDGAALATEIPGALGVPIAGAGYASIFEEGTTFLDDLATFTGS